MYTVLRPFSLPTDNNYVDLTGGEPYAPLLSPVSADESDDVQATAADPAQVVPNGVFEDEMAVLFEDGQVGILPDLGGADLFNDITENNSWVGLNTAASSAVIQSIIGNLGSAVVNDVLRRAPTNEAQVRYFVGDELFEIVKALVEDTHQESLVTMVMQLLR